MIAAETVPSKVREELVARVRTGDCILFLGAGAHYHPPEGSLYKYPAHKAPPTGSALAELLAKDCDFGKLLPKDPVHDLQRVSLCYETTPGLGRNGLVDALALHIAEGKEPSPALRMLAALPFKIILTTNYDSLFEKALRKQGKEVESLIYNRKLRTPTRDVNGDPTPERPLLFKIHGDLTLRESIVITDEDYIRFVQRMSEGIQTHPVPGTIRYRIEKWPVLFMGYSLRDYNLRLLIRTLRCDIDEANKANLYSVDPSPDLLILRVWHPLVTFLNEDLWTFVPWLYKEVNGKDFPADDES